MKKSRTYAPWEQAFERVTSPFEQFVHQEAAGGILLMAATIVALFLANTVFSEAYHQVLEIPIGLHIGAWSLEHSVHHWINEGLMTLFFFVVGLEIKREVLVGELSDPKAAALPIIAAVGGMVAPALIYYSINPSGPAASGWGVPMATDIAFAVGIMALLGKRVPPALLTFLVALAIIDDLGAVMVIALFYTEQIVWWELFTALFFFLVMIGFNRAGVRSALPYFIVGTLMWMAMLESGIHATIAGVLAALTIPTISKADPQQLSQQVRKLMDRFDSHSAPGGNLMTNSAQRQVLASLEEGVFSVQPPLKRLETSLHLPVAFIIIPLFALANAGIPIEVGEKLYHTLNNPATLGVMLGLLFGKFIGIAGLSLLCVRLGWVPMPTGTNAHHIIGVSFMGAIGFTMSIFIAELAFYGSPDQLVAAKTGILFASLIAGTIGYCWLRFVASRN